MQELFAQVNWSDMFSFFLRVFAVLLCIMVHEVSHGLAAFYLGDPTAKEGHRLSFNPIRHIDPLGLIMMITVGFGWAKPVPVDPRYFKHPQSGMAMTALAGPVSNFILAFLSCAVYQGTVAVMTMQGMTSGLTQFANFLGMLIVLNIGLGIFNLIPFPPLDGSKILGLVLPERLYFSLMRYENIGMLLLMGVLWFGYLDGPLRFLRTGVTDFMLNSTDFVYSTVLRLLG